MVYEFSTTRWTLVIEAANETEQGRAALNSLCRAYWPPLFAYARGRGLNHADAEDMTQAFFQHLLVNQAHAKADAQRGRFRSYLLTCLKNFMTNEYRNASANKRGGKTAQWLPLEEAEREMHAAMGSPETPEMIYEKQFAHTMLANALEQLHQEHLAASAQARFEALRPLLFDSEYGAQQNLGLAEMLGITSSAARTALSRFRQRYGELVRKEVARLVADPGEVDDEIAHLMKTLRG